MKNGGQDHDLAHFGFNQSPGETPILICLTYRKIRYGYLYSRGRGNRTTKCRNPGTGNIIPRGRNPKLAGSRKGTILR